MNTNKTGFSYNNTTGKPHFFVHHGKYGEGVGLSLPLVNGRKVCLTDASREAIIKRASQLTGHDVKVRWSQSNWQDKNGTVYWCGSAAWYTDAMANELVKLVEARYVEESAPRARQANNRILGGQPAMTTPQIQQPATQQPQTLGAGSFPIADHSKTPAAPKLEEGPTSIAW